MNKHLTKKYASHLIESNKLPVRKNIITQSEHPLYRQYGYPKDWERMTEEDLRS